MAVTAIVYDAPRAGLPPLAVILHNGEVLVARTAPSIVAAEKFLADVVHEFAKKAVGGG